MNPARAVRRFHELLVPAEADVGWTPYLWLVYLSFFFVEWLFRPVGGTELLWSSGTIALFLVLYFSAYRRRGLAALLHIAGMTALAVAWAPFNAGSSVLFIYAASFAFLVGPPRVSSLVVAAVAGAAAVTAWLVQPQLFYWLPGVLVSVMIGAANIFFGEQRRRNAELRLSQSETRRLARVAERERIARDLHDVLGHTLSLIAVKSELAGRLVEGDPGRAREEIASIESTAREALAEVRAAISGFQQRSLDDALEEARLSLRAADVDLVLDRDGAVDVPPRTGAMLGLVVREAVTNIIRHAAARRCEIALQRDGDEILLAVSDDGRGGIRADGLGVQGMRARIESLGGRLEIDGGGRSCLVARVPGAAA
ncbi:MAG: sensor histidine kinase [Wenzhouxiangellaceae bacterium]|nr:sensor histidine kinase [Wenzhouxiangellaceae bacterium]